MDTTQLLRALESSGVRSDAYSLHGPCDEAYCLDKSGRNWSVYYYERGIESGKKTFASECDACDYLLELLRKDSSTKRA